MHKKSINESLVSIIMSTYNETSNVLRDSVLSILEQSYTNVELIIVNDNPANHIAIEYLKSINDDRVIVLYNDRNMGLVYSLNRAIKICKGDYIARMDADDICLKTRINDQKQYLEMNNLDLIGSWISIINQEGTIIKETVRFPYKELILNMISNKITCLPHPTWFARREVFEKNNGYRDIFSCEDFDFVLRALEKGFKIGNIPKVELLYRQRDDSISRTNRSKQFLSSIYLRRNKNKICDISEEEINSYFNSYQFIKEVEDFDCYLNRDIKKRNHDLTSSISRFLNKFFYYKIYNNLLALIRRL